MELLNTSCAVEQCFFMIVSCFCVHLLNAGICLPADGFRLCSSALQSGGDNMLKKKKKNQLTHQQRQGGGQASVDEKHHGF